MRRPVSFVIAAPAWDGRGPAYVTAYGGLSAHLDDAAEFPTREAAQEFMGGCLLIPRCFFPIPHPAVFAEAVAAYGGRLTPA